MVYLVLKIFSNRVTLDGSVGRRRVLSRGEAPRNNSLEDFVRSRSAVVFITLFVGDGALPVVV